MKYPQKLSLLLQNLEAENIEYCSWKNNHELDLVLQCESDLDLLVSPSDTVDTINLLRRIGFVEARNSKIQYPNVYHFYCLEPELSKFTHIHLYTKIITGESHLKNYHFPIETTILSRRVRSDSGIYVLDSEDQARLFVLRLLAKQSSIPSRIQYYREAASYSKEIGECGVFSSSDTVSFNNTTLDSIDYDYFFSNPTSFSRNRLNLNRRKILGFRRYSRVNEFMERYAQIAYRASNKLIFKNKKNLGYEGKIVAITGLDGAGKSSSVEHLSSVYRNKFNTRVYHVGVPKPTLATWPARKLLLTLKKLKRKEKKLEAESKLANTSDSTGLLMCIRYCILAYERFKTLKSAQKFAHKGGLVILDRYPSNNKGVMDSRRIIVRENSSNISRWLGNLEDQFYAQCPVPDLLVNLVVPLEVSIHRNEMRQKENKETEQEIIERYKENSNLDYTAYKFIKLDMNRDKEQCMKDISALVWSLYSSESET